MNELAYADPEPGPQTDLPDLDRLRLHRSTSQPLTEGDSDGRYDLAFLLLERPEWHRRAACRGTDTGMFFAERGTHTQDARDTCRVCPVQTECLTHAQAVPELHGVWGGQTVRQRKKGRARPKPIGLAVTA